MPFLRSFVSQPLPLGSVSYVLPRRLRVLHSFSAVLLVAMAGILVTLTEAPLPLWGVPDWAFFALALAFFVQGFLYARFVWRYRVILSPAELRYDDGLRTRRIERRLVRSLARTPGDKPLLRFYGQDQAKPLLVLPLLFEAEGAFRTFIDRLPAHKAR